MCSLRAHIASWYGKQGLRDVLTPLIEACSASRRRPSGESWATSWMHLEFRQGKALLGFPLRGKQSRDENEPACSELRKAVRDFPYSKPLLHINKANCAPSSLDGSPGLLLKSTWGEISNTLPRKPKSSWQGTNCGVPTTEEPEIHGAVLAVQFITSCRGAGKEAVGSLPISFSWDWIKKAHFPSGPVLQSNSFFITCFWLPGTVCLKTAINRKL